MPSSSVENAINDYYEKKKSYVTLLESVMDEKQSQPTATDDKTTGFPERKHPVPEFNKAPDMPSVTLPPGDPRAMDLGRASEMIREMRAWVAKGKDKELKDMLTKMDRDLGAQSMPKE